MEQTVPQRLFFSCEGDNLAVYDSQGAKSFLRNGDARPLLLLKAGIGNILESAPKHAIRLPNGVVSIECADGTLVELNLEEESAHKTTPSGRFRYRGSLDEGNDGSGYMRA
ncbi:MAG: hypothetical protein HY680_00445 [Chloroflexi bacterium]|nr:hypothetical protein [Chloroflexota bacterium]